MSRIDAALRRAQANRAASSASRAGARLDWQDLTPAVYPTSWDLDRLPSEAAGVPTALGAAAPADFAPAAAPPRPIQWPVTPKVDESTSPSRARLEMLTEDAPMVPHHSPMALPEREVLFLDSSRANPEPPSLIAPTLDVRPPMAAPQSPRIFSDEVLTPGVISDPVRPADGDANRMFEALDRVLAESPLASSRRAVRRPADGHDEQFPPDPEST